jgi:hypothetical protein
MGSSRKVRRLSRGDWLGGALYRISEAGDAELIMDLNQGSADHELVAGESLAVIPMMMDGTVAACKVR